MQDPKQLLQRGQAARKRKGNREILSELDEHIKQSGRELTTEEQEEVLSPPAFEKR
jgi:hypothetical protein